MQILETGLAWLGTCLDKISLEDFRQIVSAVQEASFAAHRFNGQRAQRSELAILDCSEQLRNTLSLETKALLTFLSLILRAFADRNQPERRAFAQELLLPLCRQLFDWYNVDMGITELSPKAVKGPGPLLTHDLWEVLAVIPVVLSLLHGFSAFEDDDFCDHVPAFYDDLCQIVQSPHEDVRIALSAVFQRIGRQFRIVR